MGFARGAAIALITSISAVSVVACSPGGTPKTSSETHFLSTCVDDSDCPNGLTCICGGCTNACSTDGDCADLSTAAACISSCDSELSCDIACETDADCSSLEGARCAGGVCRSRPVDCLAPPASLVAWFPFDDNFDDVVGDLDASEEPTSSGITLGVPGIDWAAVEMNGDPQLAVPERPVLNVGQESFSIAFWAQGLGSVFRYGAGDNATPGYGVNLGGEDITVILADGMFRTIYMSDAGVISRDRWHHIVASVDRSDAGAVNIYVDGVSSRSAMDPIIQGSVSAPGEPIRIGSSASAFAPFIGRLDELELHSTALTAGDALELAQGFRCK